MNKRQYNLECYSHTCGTTCGKGRADTGCTFIRIPVLPSVFRRLVDAGLLSVSQIEITNDGFFMCRKPLSYILNKAGVYPLLDTPNNQYVCNKHYDDWYLYSVYDGVIDSYSLVKMRYQKSHSANNLNPGIKICFIAFDTNVLLDCLYNNSDYSKNALFVEIDRVIFQKRQRHSRVLQQYFNNPRSQGAYNIAEFYIQLIANSASSKKYIFLPTELINIVTDIISCEKMIDQFYDTTDMDCKMAVENSLLLITTLRRIPDYIDSVNRKVGYTVCDNEKIFIQTPYHLSYFEKLVILATHTGHLTLNSFAAEVKHHAFALKACFGDPNAFDHYEKALRADLAIRKEYQRRLTDEYYDLNSNGVQEQVLYHGEK